MMVSAPTRPTKLAIEISEGADTIPDMANRVAAPSRRDTRTRAGTVWSPMPGIRKITKVSRATISMNRMIQAES